MAFMFNRPDNTGQTLNDLIHHSFIPEISGVEDIETDKSIIIFALGNKGNEWDENYANNKPVLSITTKQKIDTNIGDLLFRKTDENAHDAFFQGLDSPIPIYQGARGDSRKYHHFIPTKLYGQYFPYFYSSEVAAAQYDIQHNTLNISGTIFKNPLTWIPGIPKDYAYAESFNELAIYLGKIEVVKQYDPSLIVDDKNVQYPKYDILDAYPLYRIAFDDVNIKDIPGIGLNFSLSIDASTLIETKLDSGATITATIDDETKKISLSVNGVAIRNDFASVDYVTKALEGIGAGGSSGATREAQLTVPTDGVKTSFTLSSLPANVFDVSVLLNGLLQKSSDYTFTPSTKVLTTNFYGDNSPAASTDVVTFVYHYKETSNDEA
jgi:hypothetical protein